MTTASRPAGVAGAVAVGTAAHAVAKVIHLALNVVASLALIRTLGPSGYGDYVFVLSFATLCGLLSDIGLPKIVVREISRDDRVAGSVLGTSVVTRLVLAVLAGIGAQVLLAIIGSRAEIRGAVAVASCMFLAEAVLSVVVLFEVRLEMQFEALVQVIVQAIDTLLIVVLVSLGASLWQLVAAPVVSGLIGAIVSVAIVRRRYAMRLSVDLSRVGYLLRETAPVGVTLLLAVAYLKLDSVLLGVMATSRDVGLYGSAYRPVEYLLLTSAVLTTPLFPLLARWCDRDVPRFTFVFRRGADALVALWMPVPILFLFVARPLVVTAYTDAFDAAAVPMQILGFALVLMPVSAWQGFALISAGRQRVTLIYDAMALALNVALNLILIPTLGYLGSAIASLETSVFVLIASTLITRRIVRFSSEPSRLRQIVAANVVLAGIIVLANALGAPWWLLIIGSPLPYAALLLAMRVTTLAELRALLPASGAPALAEAGT